MIDGLEGPDLPSGSVTVIAPENPMRVTAGATRTTSVFVMLPRTAFTNGSRRIQLKVSDSEGYTHTINYGLLGPSTGNTP